MNDKELEGLKHEYSEVNNYIRHYSALRFAVFTLYFGIIGGISSVAFGIVKIESSAPTILNISAKIGGLLITLVFFLFEYRLQLLVEHNYRVARKLESLLGYIQITERPKFPRLRTTYAIRGLYIMLILFWLVVIIGKA